MKMIPIRILVLTAALAFSGALHAETVRYNASPTGSKVRIDGTSTIHDWSIEGALIGGYMELPADFPLDASQPLPSSLSGTPKVEVKIPVRSLHNLKKNQSMDDITYEKLDMKNHAVIAYRLTEIKPVKAEAGAIHCDSKGELVVAGVTNVIAMPVTFEKQTDNKVKVTGATSVKMTDFKIDPPAPKIALGLIRTGDEVKLSFEWLTVPKTDK